MAEAASGAAISVSGTVRVDATAANGSLITVNGTPATTTYREASGGTVRQMQVSDLLHRVCRHAKQGIDRAGTQQPRHQRPDPDQV